MNVANNTSAISWLSSKIGHLSRTTLFCILDIMHEFALQFASVVINKRWRKNGPKKIGRSWKSIIHQVLTPCIYLIQKCIKMALMTHCSFRSALEFLTGFWWVASLDLRLETPSEICTWDKTRRAFFHQSIMTHTNVDILKANEIDIEIDQRFYQNILLGNFEMQCCIAQ